jgi:flagellar hook-basal body complex protein FliE
MILNDVQQVQSLAGIQMPRASDTSPVHDGGSWVFLNLIQQLDDKVAASDQAMKGYILEEGVSTHELMIALQNAKHSLQVAVEVRNKVVEAYDKVTRMSI